MSLSIALARARALLADGWSEPHCLNGSGRTCAPESEDAKTFSVFHAIEIYAVGIEVHEPVELLESIACPATRAFDRLSNEVAAGRTDPFPRGTVEAIAAAAGAGPESLPAWLERPGRSLSQVLRLFDLALLRAKTQEAK